MFGSAEETQLASECVSLNGQLGRARRNYTPPNKSMERQFDSVHRLATPGTKPALISAHFRRLAEKITLP